MSTATAFGNRPHAISERDENTIITDYWLNFMSVRQQDENRESAHPNLDLKAKVEDFCRRLNIRSLERRTLVNALERMRRDLGRELARDFRPSLAGSALAPLRMAKPEELRGPFAEPGQGTLLGHVRGNGL